jgi:iron complex outermembrane receptor protein
MNVQSPILSQLAYAAEFADSFEAGFKAGSLDAPLSLTMATFHTEFSDYQFSYFTGLNRRIENVPELTTKGAELEVVYQPVATVTLMGAATYQEPIFGTDGFPAGLEVIEGSTFPTASRWILSGTAQLETQLPQWPVIGLIAFNIRWQSAANVGTSATPSRNFRQAAYAIAGGRVRLMADGGTWEVDIWARNLFDQKAWSILNSTTLQPGSISGYIVDGRRWGASATARW